MAASLGLLILAGLVLLVTFLVSSFMLGGKKGDAEEDTSKSIVGTAILVIIAVGGLLTVVGGFFFVTASRVQTARNVAVARPNVQITTRTVAPAVPIKQHSRIKLALRPDEAGGKGKFILELTNGMNRPASPSLLQDEADNIAWYVEVNGENSYDAVNWDQKEFETNIAPGEKAELHLQVPLETIQAKPGDKLVIYYQYDPDNSDMAVRSNAAELGE